jgi:hypothetical protein
MVHRLPVKSLCASLNACRASVVRAGLTKGWSLHFLFRLRVAACASCSCGPSCMKGRYGLCWLLIVRTHKHQWLAAMSWVIFTGLCCVT